MKRNKIFFFLLFLVLSPSILYATPSKLINTAEPRSIVADGTTTSLITSRVADTNNNTVTTATNTITFSLTGPGTLLGTSTKQAASGIATIILESGTIAYSSMTVYAISGGLSNGTVEVWPTAGPPVKLINTAIPTTMSPDGTSTSLITARVYDINNNIVNTATNTLTFSLTGEGTLLGTSTKTPTSGLATIALRSTTTPDTATVTATSDNLSQGTVNVTTVTGPLKIINTAAPTSIVANGTSTSLITSFLCTSGNNTVTTATNTVTFSITGPGTLLGTSTRQAASGIATIILESGTVAYSSTTIHSISTGLTDGTVQVYSIPPTPAKIINTADWMSLCADGVSTSLITSRVCDDTNATVTTATNALTFTVSGTGTLLGTTTKNAVSGIGTITLQSMITPGTATVTTTSSDLSQGTVTVTTTLSCIPSKIINTASPTSLVADGAATSLITSTICDTDNSIMTTCTNALTFTVSGPGTLLGTTTKNAVSGIGTIALQSTTLPGTAIVTTTASNLSQGTVQVTTAGTCCVHIANTAEPLSITADGTATSLITSRISDASNYTITTATNMLTFTVSGQGTLLGTTTKNAISGIATIILRSTTTPGTATVTTTGANLTPSGTVQVTTTFGSPAKLINTANPTCIPADGAATSLITARICDSNNNTVTTGMNTLTFSVTGEGSLLGTTTKTAINGIATINLLSSMTVGTGTVTATSSNLDQGTVQITSSATACGASKIINTANPLSIVADGVSTSLITSRICDDLNNTITTATNTVTFMVIGAGTLVSETVKSAVSGIATVTLQSTPTTGNPIVTATATNITRGTVQVTATVGPPEKLINTAAPAIICSDGTYTSLIISKICDSSNRTIYTATNALTFTVSGEGTLLGQTTQSAISGWATVVLQATTTPGTATITTTSDALTQGIINVTSGICGIGTKLINTAEPTNICCDGSFTSLITSRICDITNNPVTTATNTLTFSVTGVGTLLGATTKEASSGLATITLRSTIMSGTATVTATTSNLTQGTVNVTSVGCSPAKIINTASPTNILADGTATSLITSKICDANNNTITTATNMLTFTILGQGTLLGTTTKSAVSGIATATLRSTTTTGTATVTTTSSSLSQGTVKVTTTAVDNSYETRLPWHGEGVWLMGDAHMHTTTSDGSFSVIDVSSRAYSYGCDWIAFTNHGVTENETNLDAARALYPSMIIFQGTEWNVPQAEHATVFITNHSSDTAILNAFLASYDGNGLDAIKAVEGLHWLEGQVLNGVRPLCMVNHPSRSGAYTIDEFRAYDDTGTVCIGFAGAPGHQKGGLYSATTEGYDNMAAIIGNEWDTLLSEGRKWWINVESDYHNVNGADHWPGDYAETRIYCSTKTPEGVINGYRAGCTWVVLGDIITALDFTVSAGTYTDVMMGEKVTAEEGLSVTANIRVKYNTGVTIDRIELITSRTGSPASTKIFTSPDWTDSSGWLEMSYDFTLTTSTYMRLRGESSDKWFYSNVIRVNAVPAQTNPNTVKNNSGGSVSMSDGFGSAIIKVPANSMDKESVIIEVKKLSELAGEDVISMIENANGHAAVHGMVKFNNVLANGSICRFKPSDDVSFDSNNPATITISYPDSTNDGIVDGTDIDERNLGIFWLDETNERWVWQESSRVYPTLNEVSLDVRHCSVYCLMSVESGEIIADVFNYPNPFSNSTTFVFTLLRDAKVTIRIYTVAGRLVKTLLDEADMTSGYKEEDWDGNDDSTPPKPLASGIYIYKVKASVDDTTVQKVGKAVIVR